MIAEDLKSRIDGLTAEEWHELSAYLTKLELENDPDYWEMIRRRVAGTNSDRLVSVDEV